MSNSIESIVYINGNCEEERDMEDRYKKIINYVKVLPYTPYATMYVYNYVWLSSFIKDKDKKKESKI